MNLNGKTSYLISIKPISTATIWALAGGICLVSSQKGTWRNSLIW